MYLRIYVDHDDHADCQLDPLGAEKAARRRAAMAAREAEAFGGSRATMERELRGSISMDSMVKTMEALSALKYGEIFCLLVQSQVTADCDQSSTQHLSMS